MVKNGKSLAISILKIHKINFPTFSLFPYCVGSLTLGVSIKHLQLH